MYTVQGTLAVCYAMFDQTRPHQPKPNCSIHNRVVQALHSTNVLTRMHRGQQASSVHFGVIDGVGWGEGGRSLEVQSAADQLHEGGAASVLSFKGRAVVP